MGDLRLGRRIVYDVKANWKLIVLNYNECLHCPNLHPALNRLHHYLGADNVAPTACYCGGAMGFRDGVETMSMDGKRRRAYLPGLNEAQRQQVVYFAIYPNLLLSLHPDYVMTHTLWPRAHDRTEIVCEWHFHPDELARADFAGRRCGGVLGSDEPRGLVDRRAIAGRHQFARLPAGAVLGARGAALELRRNRPALRRRAALSVCSFSAPPRDAEDTEDDPFTYLTSVSSASTVVASCSSISQRTEGCDQPGLLCDRLIRLCRATLQSFNGHRRVPPPVNEPIRSYAPGSPERDSLKARLKTMAAEKIDMPLIIGGKEIRTGNTAESVMPHDHQHVLGDVSQGDRAARACRRSRRPRPRAPNGRAGSFDDRAAVLLKAAELLTTSWRDTINAATMLGQSKTAFQAEIDATVELIDFWRFNALLRRSSSSTSSRSATTRCGTSSSTAASRGSSTPCRRSTSPSIGGNLPTAPALMGNTVVWKPASSAMFSAYYLMKLYEAAGMPPGVINFVAGDAAMISKVLLSHRDLAGVHFTGSTEVFNDMWKTIGALDVHLPLLPAHRRRNRRQGLHRRPPVGGRRRARGRDRARRRSSSRARSARRRAGSTCRDRCGTRCAIARSR